MSIKKCENCQNQKICKYTEDFTSCHEAVQKISQQPFSPVRISVCCKEFRNKDCVGTNPRTDIKF